MSTTKTKRQTEFLRYLQTLGIAAMDGRGFYYPCDTVVNKDGRVYTLSRGLFGRGVRVTRLNVDSEYFGIFASNGEGDGQFKWPTAIELDSRNQIYVSDEYTHRISVFDDSGEFLRKWGAHGSGPGELNAPSGLAFDTDDNLYVSDQKNNRVQKFASDGQFLSAFGSEGSGDGQFDLPWGVTVAAGGEVYVADWRNDRIQKFGADGEFLGKYGTSGHGDGELHRPASVAVDDEGYMYVADWGNERVQVLDPEGGFVMKLRGQATLSAWAEEFLDSNLEERQARDESDLEPDVASLSEGPHDESSHIEKLFWAPVSVKLDSEGRLYVTESNRHRVQVFGRTS